MNTDAKNPQQNISKMNSMNLKDHTPESNGIYPECKNGAVSANQAIRYFSFFFHLFLLVGG